MADGQPVEELNEKQKSRLMYLADRAGIPYEEARAKNLSQNALKKIASKKKYEEALRLKRQEEKCKRKMYAQHKKEAGTWVKKKRKQGNLMKNSDNKVIVAIDLSFNDLMTEKDLKKLRKQILRCYSSNRGSPNPLQFYLTSCTKSIKDSFTGLTSGFENWDVHMSESNFLETFKDLRNQENGIVYLTRDSPNVLPEYEGIRANMGKTAYIIGGLVDHNCHKNLTIDLAMKEKIGHARLPIGENIRMTKSHVLTVNHVFELMVRVSQGDTWKSALEQIIPQRKICKDANGRDVQLTDDSNSEGDNSQDEKGTSGDDASAKEQNLNEQSSDALEPKSTSELQ